MNRSRIYTTLGIAASLLLVGAGPAMAQFSRPQAYAANLSTAEEVSPCGAQNIVAPILNGSSPLSNVYTNVNTNAEKVGPGPQTWYSGPAWGYLEAYGYSSPPGLGNQTTAEFYDFQSAAVQSGTYPVLYYSVSVADGSCAYILVNGGGASTGAIAISIGSQQPCYTVPGSYGSTCYIALPADTNISALQVWFTIEAANSPSGPPGIMYIQDVWVGYVPQA